jgi:hypothetical protein
VLNTLLTILVIIGACVVLASFAFAVAYFVLSRRLAHKMQETVDAMEVMLAKSVEADAFSVLSDSSPDSIPPMKIRLLRSDRKLFSDTPLCERIDEWLIAHGFERNGCYVVEELDEEELCIYLSDDRKLVGSIRQPAHALEPFVEFCFDLSDNYHLGYRGGVSNPPEGTLALPSDAIGRHFGGRLSENFGLLSQMWLEAKELVDRHRVQLVSADKLAEFYEEAHAVEMECRMRAGGVTESEVRASFAAQGIEPTDEDVAGIVAQWQTAISEHLLDLSPKAESHLEQGQHVLVVHDSTEREFLTRGLQVFFNSLKDAAPTENDLVGEFRMLLTKFSPRDAVARFRALLPSQFRYRLIDQIRHPVEADFYVMAPETAIRE